MDLIGLKKKTGEALRKYRAAAVVILAGILLMALPGKSPKPSPELLPAPKAPETGFEEKLQAALSLIEGAGKVSILLSEEAGEVTNYQNDEDRSGQEGAFRRSTVIVTNRDRQESGLIRQVNPPKYRGAVVLAQGADSPRVKLAITEAVVSATGLTSNKVTVLKMK